VVIFQKRCLEGEEQTDGRRDDATLKVASFLIRVTDAFLFLASLLTPPRFSSYRYYSI